MSTPHLGHI
jgi:hypothetical protein